MISRLLHIANSSPPGPKAQRERFYAMKSRILERYAIDDGTDLQHLPGKPCWSCDGSGIYYHYSGTPDDCHKCCGSGWYKSPVYVALRRWKLGRYTFHQPKHRLTLWQVAKVVGIDPSDLSSRELQEMVHDTVAEAGQLIDGYVEHAHYSSLAIDWSTLVLGVLFDWGVAADVVRDWWRWSWPHAVLTRRCHTCKRRLWTARQWTCRDCLLNPKPETYDEIPF